MDWMVSQKMNTVQMSVFLSQVSAAHPADSIIMVLDGARSHKAKDLQRPENIRLVALPTYSPELNPQEHVWDELREKEFPNRVFNDIDAVVRQLPSGLPRLTADHGALRGLTAWPWIVSLNLKANWNNPVHRLPDICYIVFMKKSMEDNLTTRREKRYAFVL
jgi:hypothetical protein